MPDHPAHTRARVDANSELQLFTRAMSYPERFRGIEHAQRALANLRRMTLLITFGQAADQHVSVTNRLDLVHIIRADNRVEHRVKVVQHVYDLNRRAGAAQFRESDNIAEKYRDAFVRTGRHREALF